MSMKPILTPTATTVPRADLQPTSRSSESGSDDVVPDGKLDEFGRRFHLELFHHLILVKRDGARRDVQHASDFLHSVALGEELQHLPLTPGQHVGRRACVRMQQRSHQPRCDWA